MSITISSLIHYPIKACRGFEVASAEVERMGLQHDRRMMVTTPDGRFLTQREHPRLALITLTLKDGVLELSAPEFDSLRLNIRSTGTSHPVTIWKVWEWQPSIRVKRQRSGSLIGWAHRYGWSILPTDTNES